MEGGGGEGALIRGGRGAYFKFRPIGGALTRKGRFFEGGGEAGGGAISEIYGNSITSFYRFSDYDVIPPITPYTPPSL